MTEMTEEERQWLRAGTRRWGRKASPQGFQSLIGHPVAVRNEKILFQAFLDGGAEGLRAKMDEMFGTEEARRRNGLQSHQEGADGQTDPNPAE